MSAVRDSHREIRFSSKDVHSTEPGEQGGDADDDDDGDEDDDVDDELSVETEQDEGEPDGRLCVDF